jgi:hypothetical protein
LKLEVVGVGPQKTGTSWLYECLRGHPRLCFPLETKETFFFDQHFDKGWSWYWSHFHHRRGNQLCAEIGPSYFDVPAVTERLKQHNPSASIIVSLRDPADRSFSLYLHHRRKGRIGCNFHKATQIMPRIIDSSCYRKHLKRWLGAFGRERVHIVLLRDIASSPQNVLRDIYDFLNISPISAPSTAHKRVYTASRPRFSTLARLVTSISHWLRGKRLYGIVNLAKRLGVGRVYEGSDDSLPELSSDARKALIEEFESDITYVERLLGRSLPEWRT